MTQAQARAIITAETVRLDIASPDLCKEVEFSRNKAFLDEGSILAETAECPLPQIMVHQRLKLDTPTESPQGRKAGSKKKGKLRETLNPASMSPA